MELERARLLVGQPLINNIIATYTSQSISPLALRGAATELVFSTRTSLALRYPLSSTSPANHACRAVSQTDLSTATDPDSVIDNQLIPLSNYGLKSMSMGYLIPESSPVAWRGLMVMKALQQLLHEVEWGGLDVLVLDMPPGTGDVQLTITQQLNLDGALIVSTPQDLSLKDAVKGVELFKKVNVNLLGLVCNMAGFKCPGCGSVHEIFGNMKKIRDMCGQYDLKMLGEIPLHTSISDDADRGKPTVVAEPDGERAAAFLEIAREVEAAVGLTR